MKTAGVPAGRAPRGWAALQRRTTGRQQCAMGTEAKQQRAGNGQGRAPPGSSPAEQECLCSARGAAEWLPHETEQVRTGDGQGWVTGQGRGGVCTQACPLQVSSRWSRPPDTSIALADSRQIQGPPPGGMSADDS